MTHRRDCAQRQLCVGVASLLLCAGAAVAGPIQVIFTKIPGTPKAAVPGAVDLTGAAAATDFRALEDMFISPDGSRWMLKGRTQLGSDLENILISGSGTAGTRLVQEGNFIPGGLADERYEFFGSGVGRFNELNHFAFSARARTMATGSTSAPSGQRVLYWDGTTITLKFKEGDLITGLSDTGATGDERVGNSVGSIHPRNDGTIGSQDSTITGIATSRRPAIMYDLAGFRQSNVSTLTDIDGSTIATWGTLTANAFFTTPDNATWMAQGRTVAQGTSGTILVRNNAAVLKTGSQIGTTGVILDTIPQWNLLSNGSWNARGTVPTPSADKWAVVNGTLVAKTGDPIITGSTELWGTTFYAFNSNRNNQWVLAGTTNSADPATNEVLVYNGTQVLAREGDPVDINGNGMFDDDAFIGRGNNTLAAFEASDLDITDGRMVYFIASLRNAAGQDLNSSPAFVSPQAFMRIQVSNPCPADFNGANGVTVQDIFDFLSAWFAGLPTADSNGANGVTVQDIFDFLSAWFAGCP